MATKSRAGRPAGQTDAVTIARELADAFRPHAAKYDETGEFPVANYDQMREAGYLRALVPAELGGLGTGLLAMSQAQQALARGDASTALAVNMHHFQVGFMADGWRKTQAAPAEKTLRRIADEGIVLGSTGAEAIVVGDWATPTVARRDGDGYRITGKKYFCSQAPGMNVVRVNARDADTGEFLVIGVPVPAEGFSIVETWDTTGMRATASHDIVFEDVFVPETAVGARLPMGPTLIMPPIVAVMRWFFSLVSGVYLGIAEEARAEAYKALGTGINSTFRNEALTDVMIGQMEADFMTAVAVRDQIVGHMDSQGVDPMAVAPQATLCKQIVIDRSNDVVERAVQIAGGRAFYRKSPLERLARDVRAGRFHPLTDPSSYQFVGQRYREGVTAEARAAV
jgi:alkylation response protein AidB-like acyl-CoA dehydrogenase